MQHVTMFSMASCPHCKRAFQWMEELFAEHPEYKEVPVKVIDEVQEPAVAATYDYYYVPTYYVEHEKRHEGAATKEKIEQVFIAAIEDQAK